MSSHPKLARLRAGNGNPLAQFSNAVAGMRMLRPMRTAGMPSRPPVSEPERRTSAYAAVRLIRRRVAASCTGEKRLNVDELRHPSHLL